MSNFGIVDVAQLDEDLLHSARVYETEPTVVDYQKNIQLRKPPMLEDSALNSARYTATHDQFLSAPFESDHREPQMTPKLAQGSDHMFHEALQNVSMSSQ